MDSLVNFVPEAERVLLLVERPLERDMLFKLETQLLCKVLTPDQLDPLPPMHMAFQYDALEFNCSLKPFMLQHLFRQGKERVIYLDSDTELFHPLSAIWSQLETHDVIITPHILAPLPEDGYAPSNENIIRSGQYNAGFLAFSNRASSTFFVCWWADRLTNHCIFHHNHYYFLDQFYVSMAVSFVSTCLVLHDQGYNFAYWNAGQRALRYDKSIQRWMVGDRPLVFAHFSGFVTEDPERISRHQNRFRAELRSALADLMHHYAGELLAWEQEVLAAPYSFATYDDGVVISAQERRIFRDLDKGEKQRFVNPFSVATREFLQSISAADEICGLTNFELGESLLKQKAQNLSLQQKLTTVESLLSTGQVILQKMSTDFDNLSSYVASLEQEVFDLRASRSFRLGHSLLKPFGFLRRFFNAS